MNTKSYVSKLLFALVFGLVLLGTSVTAPADKPVPATAKDGVQNAPIMLAQFVPCPNGKCRQ